jgi:hypothetical protein
MFLGITFPFFGGLLSFFGGLAFAPTTYFVSFPKDPCMIALIDPFFFPATTTMAHSEFRIKFGNVF